MAQLFRKSSIEKLSSPEQLDKSIVVTSPMSWIALIGIAFIVVCFVIWAICGSMPSTMDAKGIISNGIYTNSVYSEYAGKISEICVAEGDKINKEDVICKVIDENGEVHSIYAMEDCIVTKQLVQIGDAVNYSDEIFGISPVSSKDNFAVFYVGIEQLPSIHSGMEVIINMPAFDNQKYGHMKGTIVHIDKFASTENSIKRVIGNNEDVINYLGTMEQPVVALTCVLQKDNTSANGLFWSNEAGKNLSVNIGSVVDVKVVLNESAPITKLIPGYNN